MPGGGGAGSGCGDGGFGGAGLPGSGNGCGSGSGGCGPGIWVPGCIDGHTRTFHSIGGGIMPFKLVSRAFTHEDQIPRPYSREGGNISPPLAWTDAPALPAGFPRKPASSALSSSAWVQLTACGPSLIATILASFTSLAVRRPAA